MKRWTMLASAAALAVLVGGSGIAGQAQRTQTPAAALPAVQALADRYVAEGKAAGIVFAVARGDAPPTFVSAGKLATDPGAATAGPDSLWRVYSMTKPVTAVAAMILIEEGKLKLDQPIAELIPAFRNMTVLTDPAKSLASRPAARPITVRHLLTHTAGLGYSVITKGPLLDAYQRQGIEPAQVSLALEGETRKRRPISLTAFADRVATLPLIADPGTKWSYSIALDVLGRVIEVASGESFDGFVQKRIFDPLGMRSSYWTVPAGETGRLATNYFWAGERPLPIDPGSASVFAQAPSFPYGGAGLVMSARDHDRFLHMLANGGTLGGAHVLKPETAKLAMSNLLPAGVTFGGVGSETGGTTGAGQGFGAGGSVTLNGAPGALPPGTYGWGGAAGTIGFVNAAVGVRVTVMVNYFPSDKWPLRADTVRALASDLAR